MNERAMGGCARLLAEREQEMNRSRLAAARARSSSDLACLLDRARDRVGGVVEGDPRGSKNDLRVESTFEQELGGVVAPARDRGEQMGGRRLLTSLLRRVLCQAPQ